MAKKMMVEISTGSRYGEGTNGFDVTIVTAKGQEPISLSQIIRSVPLGAGCKVTSMYGEILQARITTDSWDQLSYMQLTAEDYHGLTLYKYLSKWEIVKVFTDLQEALNMFACEVNRSYGDACHKNNQEKEGDPA
jgi:hypothetical protein